MNRMTFFFVSISLILIACNGDNDHDRLHFHVPDSQFDQELISGFLEKYDLPDPKEFPDPPLQEEFIRGRIEIYKRSLDKEEAIEEKMIRFFIYTHIGSYFEQLYRFEPAAVDSVIRYREKAISIYEDDPAYKNDLAGNYSNLALGYIKKGDFNAGFSLYRKIIEEYADSGIGFFPKWFPVDNIQTLYRGVFYDIARRNPHDPKMKEVAAFLEHLSEKYDNEIGLAARVHLFKYYYKTGQDEKAQRIKQIIVEEFPAYEDNEFIWRMWIGVPEEIERRIELGEFEYQV